MKQEIRQKMKDILEHLDERENKSDLIQEQCFNLECVSQGKFICVYVSKGNEVQTHKLITWLLKTSHVLIPYIEGDSLKVGEICSFFDLEKGFNNILEPKKKEFYEGEIDVIIVPGVAFDIQCNRLGRGRGFYDFFLQAKISKKVGLAFNAQVTDLLPVESHDVVMDMVVTETQVIHV